MADNNQQKKPATRPLPNLAEMDTAPFWAGTAEGEFRYQQCSNCGTVVWHPRSHCTGCVDGDLQWKVSAGKGTLYSFSVVRQSYHPFFRNQVPYVVALVDLDGDRAYGADDLFECVGDCSLYLYRTPLSDVDIGTAGIFWINRDNHRFLYIKDDDGSLMQTD